MISQKVAQEIVLIILILLYSTVLGRLVPKKYHLYLNIGIAAVAITLGLAFGLSLENMGLALDRILPGIYWAFIISAAIILLILVISTIPILRRFFIGDNLSNANGKLIAFEAAVRIPLGTALVEEILFRGVLLGLLLQHHPTFEALVIAAAIFGLWHIFPTMDSMKSNAAAAKAIAHKTPRAAGSVIGVIILTSIAGLFFGWLRILANSIVAPWLVHWSVNASGVVGIAVATKLQNRSSTKRKKVKIIK
jgi:membrane protease YdiL (CAAX protease family)